MSEPLTSEQRAELQVLMNRLEGYDAINAERDSLCTRLAISDAEIEMYRSTMQGLTTGDLLSAQKTKAERDSLRARCEQLEAALLHQRNALLIIRDRQNGKVWKRDLEQGIALIDAAIATPEPSEKRAKE